MINAAIPLLGLLFILANVNCKKINGARSLDTWKKEIRAAEESFANMAMELGIEKAFITYAAPDAVLMRDNSLVKGLDEIQGHFASQESTGNTTLTWSPDFVDVASSGDLGYTYGQYTYTGIDTAGQIFESKGIFHTVWKRQPDGSWRFVWD